MMQRGFTLMELLVAITILALATALVFESFVSVTSTTDLARAEAARLRERQFIWRNFAENMNAIYSDSACALPEFALLGEDGAGPVGPGDSITFCTSLPMPGAGALPGELRGVSYEVVGPEGVEAPTPTAAFSGDVAANAEPPAYLVISEFPVFHDQSDGVSVDEATEEERTRVRQIPITSMDILYYDPETQEWVDEWDSTAEQHLPWAIEVLITLARGPEEDLATVEPDLDMTFLVPLGAGATETFIDPNHMYIDPNSSGDPDSIFNKDATDRAGGGNKRNNSGPTRQRNYKR